MIVAVKLGGAAITYKSGVCEYSSHLDVILDQVQSAYEHLKAQGDTLILIHGAGSFGHPQALKYQLKTGWSCLPESNQLKGLCHIRTTLQQLNTKIIAGLDQRGLPVLSLSPMDYMIDQQDLLMDRVRRYLELGCVLVLHGDVVLDRQRGLSILSGDRLLYLLSQSFPVTRCVFVTDVQGLFKADPKLKQADSFVILPHFKCEGIEQDDPVMGPVVDVTGGMKAKVGWAKRIVKECETQVVLCRWGTIEALDMMCLKETFTDQMTRFS